MAKAWRGVERFALGVVFGFAAWIIERRVLKAIKKKGQTPPGRGTISEQTTSELEKPTS